MSKKPLTEYLWDLWCIVSIVGIWPRFVEPTLLSVTKKSYPIRNLSSALNGLKIVHLSDLHLNDQTPDRFIDKLIRKVNALSPDIIVFTGDFLCYASMKHRERLKQILCSFKAPYGCYATLGNHDYAAFVSINSKGEYDTVCHESPTIVRGLKRLCTTVHLQRRSTPRAQAIPLNQELVELFQETPFKLLHNDNALLTILGAQLNLCGLGEYSLGRCLPEEAFKDYNSEAPGIVLSHNPDSISLLKDHPGELILSGHTHGGQINLPWLWKKFTLMENPSLKRGLVEVQGKQLYINRGLGSVMRFRWFARPEILQLTLVRS